MCRSAVSSLLPPAAVAAATLGFGVAPPQARTLAVAATSPRLGHCSPPCPRPRPRLRRSSSPCSSSAASAATTALAVEEARRGRKQLGMDPSLYDYLLSNVREHPVLRDLREETASMRGSQMQVSPAQAQLLAMLVQILGAERCIEVGVYTGYSSLAVALALPESGRLVACERDERCLEVAKRYYQLVGVAHKVDVKHALAVDSLRSLLDCGEASSYDFAFVDADKRMYEEYFELLLKLVRVGGLIVMDNVLWYGRLADPLVIDPKTISIRDFNKKLLEDKRITISMKLFSHTYEDTCQRRARWRPHREEATRGRGPTPSRAFQPLGRRGTPSGPLFAYINPPGLKVTGAEKFYRRHTWSRRHLESPI